MDGTVRNMSSADDVRQVPNGRIEIVKVAGAAVGRVTYEPGFRWSSDVKPIAGTDLCEVDHLAYIVSGRFRVRLKDGAELEAGPGDVAAVPAGHDGWVVGDEPVVMIDMLVGDSDYARPE